MSTAVETKPLFPQLRIDVGNLELSKASAKTLAAYHRGRDAFESRVRSELHDSRRGLLANAMDAAVGDVMKHGQQLVQLKTALEDELRALLWQRFELMGQLLADVERSAEAATANYEQRIAEHEKMLADIGVTAETIAPANPRAGQIQLRHRIDSEYDVLATKGAANSAEALARGFKSAATVPPREDSCRITWQPVTDEFERSIAKLADVL